MQVFCSLYLYIFICLLNEFTKYVNWPRLSFTQDIIMSLDFSNQFSVFFVGFFFLFSMHIFLKSFCMGFFCFVFYLISIFFLNHFLLGCLTESWSLFAFGICHYIADSVMALCGYFSVVWVFLCCLFVVVICGNVVVF